MMQWVAVDQRCPAMGMDALIENVPFLESQRAALKVPFFAIAETG